MYDFGNQVPFYYCTQQTSIQGVLTLTRDVIFFDPDPVNDEIEVLLRRLCSNLRKSYRQRR